jgi:Mobilization protein NikA
VNYASGRTAEENAALVERVKAMFAERRARGEAPGTLEPTTPEHALEQLEDDQRAGRTVKWDVRTTPEEKLRWAEAASTLGLSVSEFVRDVANQAAEEVLAGEPVSV